MNAYETTAIVEAEGTLHINGVPFAPGTKVEIEIRALAGATGDHAPEIPEQARVPMRELFGRVEARNTESVGPLHREEIYDRKILRGH